MSMMSTAGAGKSSRVQTTSVHDIGLGLMNTGAELGQYFRQTQLKTFNEG